MTNHNDLDLSDLKEILEKEEKGKKSEIFQFPYENINRKNNNSFFKKLTFQGLKERKLVSNRIDPELPDNSIQTYKYTALNFFPKNLLEQFSKKATLYFLFIGIMQTIPYISISEGIPAIFLPLAFVLAITALKDLFEDRKRKKSDIEENMQKTMVWEKNSYKETVWKMLRVGNIIKVSQNEYLPADIILLNTSEKRGMCYVETKNLDGETNLKAKIVKKELGQIFKTEDFTNNRVIFQYERPSNYLYCFNGNFTNENTEQFSLDLSNFILRGSCLKNTKYIFGFVAFTGHETKIMLNSFKPKSKMSNVEKMMGKQILIIFFVQMFLCLLCSIIYLSFYEANKNYLPYLSIGHTDIIDNAVGYNLFIRYGNWTLIFTNFVPISLMVTLEAVKVFQALVMRKDPKMVSNSDFSSMNVQSSNLNEELGQIEYVFSDKTGTLTCNKMDFKCISIKGKSYGLFDQTNPKYIQDYKDFPKVTNVDFHDGDLIEIMQNKVSAEHENVKNALFFLAICHSVVFEINNDVSNYNASSPDELALVNFAKFCGVEFKGINDNQEIIVKYGEEEKNFKFLYEFEFNSERKRHSIIFQNHKREIILYCKGADSVIENLLDRTKQNYEKTWNHLRVYGNQGLRTLVLAEKLIDEEFFQIWRRKYEFSKSILENRAEKMRELQEEIEKDLVLIGATAIEDKLQDDVDTTIQALKDAGIKVWVLTGDKIETAINIGYSCGLLDNSLTRYIIEEKTEVQLEENFNRIIEQIEKNEYSNNALIIHGDSLVHIVIKPFLCKKMVQICKKCISVLCCRVSPKQKQEVVTIMKNEFPNCSTLAIGDGANDVNMITAAHVGIGIKGVEGHQASRASDYSISEFRFLRRLLFYYGRECYRRNSKVVCYNFFKNICLVLPLFWYGAFNFFSGLSLYDAFIYQLFNILYSSVPILIYAVIDREHKDTVLIENKLNYYAQGIEKKLFNTKIFWSWFFYGSYVSVILAYFSFYCLELNFQNDQGLTFNFWETSTTMYSLVVITTNIQIAIFSNTYNFLSFFCLYASIGLYPLTLLVYTNVIKTEFSVEAITKTKVEYLIYLIIIAATCLPFYFFEMLKKFQERQKFKPRKENIMQFQGSLNAEALKDDGGSPLNPPQKDQKDPAKNYEILKIKLYDNDQSKILGNSISKENNNGEILENSKDPVKTINFGINVATDKSINSGTLLKKKTDQSRYLDKPVCATPIGGGRTPNHQKTVVVVGEFIKNDEANMPHLGFAFSQDIADEE